MKEVTPETTLAEILKLSKSEEVLAKHNVPCLGCAFAQLEMKKLKIGQVCQMYGINLDKLIKDLNALK